MTKFKTFIPSSESERSDYFYALYLNFNFYNDLGDDKWYYQVIPDCLDDVNFPYIAHAE